MEQKRKEVFEGVCNSRNLKADVLKKLQEIAARKKVKPVVMNRSKRCVQ